MDFCSIFCESSFLNIFCCGLYSNHIIILVGLFECEQSKWKLSLWNEAWWWGESVEVTAIVCFLRWFQKYQIFFVIHKSSQTLIIHWVSKVLLLHFLFLHSLAPSHPSQISILFVVADLFLSFWLISLNSVNIRFPLPFLLRLSIFVVVPWYTAMIFSRGLWNLKYWQQ